MHIETKTNSTKRLITQSFVENIELESILKNSGLSYEDLHYDSSPKLTQKSTL
jgi:hypothetical protein